MKALLEFFRILNQPCHGMTGLMSHDLDEPLPFGPRLAVRIHTLYCTACRRYKQQLSLLREGLRRFLTMSTDPRQNLGPSLSADARERIARALRQN